MFTHDMETPLDHLLGTTRPIIMDGGFATELERSGKDLNNSLWSARILIEDPAAIEAVHLSFLRAGCDIIETSSYQISRQGFEHSGVEGWEDYLVKSVDLANSAVDRYLSETGCPSDHITHRPVVAVSLGPLGAIYHDGSEFSGTYGLPGETPIVPPSSELVSGRQDLASLIAFHRDRLAVLARSRVDCLAFETIPCKLEAIAIATLLKEFPDFKAWLSFSCKDGSALSSGEPLLDTIREVLATDSCGVIAFGVNCSSPHIIQSCIEKMSEAISSAGASAKVLVYPNRGELWNAATGEWYTKPGSGGTPSDDEFIRMAQEWFLAGAWAVGGCCRTTSELLSRLRSVVVTSCVGSTS